MKKLLLSIALSVGVLANPVQAQDNMADEMCTLLGELAFEVVTLRQSGVPMFETRRVLQEEVISPRLREVLDSIVFDAYALPKMHSERGINSQASEFSSEIYFYCISAIGDVS